MLLCRKVSKKYHYLVLESNFQLDRHQAFHLSTCVNFHVRKYLLLPPLKKNPVRFQVELNLELYKGEVNCKGN